MHLVTLPSHGSTSFGGACFRFERPPGVVLACPLAAVPPGSDASPSMSPAWSARDGEPTGRADGNTFA